MKFVKTAALALAVLFVSQVAANAQAPVTETAVTTPAAETIGTLFDLRGVGVGLVIIGAGLGIGGLTKSALESMARQPEILAPDSDRHDHLRGVDRGCLVLRLIIIAFLLAEPFAPGDRRTRE